MSTEIIIVVAAVCLLALFVMGFLIMGTPAGGQVSTKNQMQRIVQAQRQEVVRKDRSQTAQAIFEAAQEARVEKQTTSRLTLEKKLRFAQWKMPPLLFRVIEIAISIVVACLVNLKFDTVLTVIGLLAGPIFMRWLLTMFIEKRFKAFDADYAPFLLSLVSLLKTGMNTMTAIEAAAKGLEDGSLVKEEVILMLERLRYGVSEEKSIGAFGEDIFHPEIELFVQALLLSRRVGGNLSETLDRLAKQVRKRQFFRESAVAAVGMQRGSIWFILCIMVAMEVYLYFVYPQAITDAIKDSLGWQVWQVGIVAILLGMYWVRQVTKIRV